MANNTRTFSDLDLNFTKNPVTMDVTRRYDEDAVKNALKNLILDFVYFFIKLDFHLLFHIHLYVASMYSHQPTDRTHL
jgi:hypothetical protein